ncbi:hypothetical protein BGW38_000121, partial [Lunasporangiospora selenospora]
MHRERSLSINTSKACLLKHKLAKLNCSLTNNTNDNNEDSRPSTPVPPSCRLNRIYEEKLEVLGSIGYENWFDDNAEPFYRHEPPALELPPPAPEPRSNHTQTNIQYPSTTLPITITTAKASTVATVTPAASMAEKTMEQPTLMNDPLRSVTFGQIPKPVAESTPSKGACITPLQTPTTAIQAKIDTKSTVMTPSTDNFTLPQESNKSLPTANGSKGPQLSEKGPDSHQNCGFPKSSAAGPAAERKATITTTTTPAPADHDLAMETEMFGGGRFFSFDSEIEDNDKNGTEEHDHGFHDYTRGRFNHSNNANAALFSSSAPVGRSPEMDSLRIAFVTPEVPTSNPKGLTFERLQRRLSNRNRIMDRGQLLPDTILYASSPPLQTSIRFGAGAGPVGGSCGAK